MLTNSHLKFSFHHCITTPIETPGATSTFFLPVKTHSCYLSATVEHHSQICQKSASCICCDEHFDQRMHNKPKFSDGLCQVPTLFFSLPSQNITYNKFCHWNLTNLQDKQYHSRTKSHDLQCTNDPKGSFKSTGKIM